MVAARRLIGPAVLLLGLGLVLHPDTANAQFRAAIQGTVTDTSGGAVPGVTVVVANTETGVQTETVTNEAGFYRVSGLAPGMYKVTVTLQGFKENVTDNVRVSAEETQGLDVQLQPGGLEETVTVTSEPPVISTQNAEIGGTISTVEVQTLPQIGRDPYELIRLTPGVFGLGLRSGTGNSIGFPNQTGPGGSNASVFQTENQVPVSANGQRVEGNNFQLDGVSAMSQAWGGAAVVTPNQESVKEIRVVASPYSAEFGRNTGAQVQVVSQNGTNAFHGSAVFKRNTPGLNSFNGFFGPHGEAPQRVNQLLSQYAGSLGGPILTDKLFFFFSYEGYRRRSNTLGTTWVETPELLEAIRTQRPNSLAAQFVTYPGTTPRIANVLEMRDIGSLTGGPGQVVGNPLGGGLDGIPDVQRAELAAFDNTTSQQFNLRIDFPFTQSDQLAFSTYIVPVDREFTEATGGNFTRPMGDFTSERRNMVGTVLWTRAISPTLLNEARFNVTRWYFNEIESNPEMPWGIPRLSINQAIPESQNFTFGVGVGPGVFYQTSYNARNTVTKVMNAHALRFGGEVIFEQNNDKAPWAGRPTYNFNNFWSFANDAPLSEGTTWFEPSTGEFTELAAYARSSYYALFVQDDWRLRSNLTVNLGLRWEYFAPLTSKNDRISNLVLGPDGSLVDASLRVGGDLYESDLNNFAPQVGFAWTPTRFEDRLVVRGGFGMGYNRLPGSRVLEARFNPPFFAGFFLEGNQVLYAGASDPLGFSYPANPAATLTFDPNTGLPLTGPAVSVNATSEELPHPYVLRYSLDTEYNLGRGWVLGLGYQGSSGRQLPRVVPYQRFVSPNPRLGAVNLLLTDARSNYNALLTRVQHRFDRGYLVGAEYRWSKSLDTCSNDHDCRQTYPFDQDTEWGPSDYDVPHSFKLFATWDLPIFRDRNDLLELVAGGWQFSGILTASSGYPWTPVFGGDLCQVVVAGGGVCPLRPIAYTGNALEETSDDVFQQPFGQFPGGPLEYFTPPPAGSFERPPVPGVGRNSFRGPKYFSVDMAAFKRFAFPPIAGLGDDAGIEFRVNAFNVFNNLNLEPFAFNQDNTRIEHPDFGRALRGLAGRIVEFQARFSF